MKMTSYEAGTPSWVDLSVPDPPAAGEFYRALLGWEIEDPGPDSGGYQIASLRGEPVAGIGPQFQPGAPPAWTTYVSVDDADATTAAVRAAGGQVVVEPMDVLTVGRMAVYFDTTGAAVAAWQPRDHIGAGLVNEQGTLCWNELATRDTAAAKEFYRDVFGWEGAAEPMGPIDYTEWKLNGRTVGGMLPMDDSWPSDVPSHWAAYFAVEDAGATGARATELGGGVRVPPTDIPPGLFSVLVDPQGASFNVIALREVPQS